MKMLKSVEDCPYCYGTGNNSDPDRDIYPKCRACNGSGLTNPIILQIAINEWIMLQDTNAFVDIPNLHNKTYDEFKTNDPIGALEFERQFYR